MANENVKVGDIVQERLQFDTKSTTPYKGKVIYLHPERRFYRAEFKLAGGKVTEAFLMARPDQAEDMNETEWR